MKNPFFGLSSFQILAMFRRGLFYTYLSIYLRNFLNLSVTETTLYATLPMIMSVIFQNFVWGPLSDKFQKRRTFIISGEIIAGIGTILVWLIHHSFTDYYLAGYVIIIGLSCVEIFWSMSNIGWSALISDLYPSLDRSKIMGRLTSIGGLGRMIGIFFGGILYDNGYGFRNGDLFFIASSIMFLSTIPMFFTPEGGINYAKNAKNVNFNTDNNVSERFRFIFFMFILSLIFINFGRNSIATTYSQFLVLDSGFNVDSLTLSFIANARSFAVLIIGMFAGLLSKKFGHSKSLIFGISLGIIALIITATAFYLSLIFVGSFLMGTSEVIIYASSYALASDLIPPKFRARFFGIYNATFFLSWGLASTIISGPLIDYLITIMNYSEVFSYQISFMVATIITSIGLLIFVLLHIYTIFLRKKIKKN